MPRFLFMLSRTAIPAGPAKSGVSGLICKRRGSLEEHEIGSYPSPSVWKPETLCLVSSFVNGGFYWDYAWFFDPRCVSPGWKRLVPAQTQGGRPHPTTGHLSIFCGTFPRMGNGHTRSRSWTSPFSDPYEALRRSGRPRPQLPQRSQWFPSLHKGNPTSFTPPY